jgi:hypothetical protein
MVENLKVSTWKIMNKKITIKMHKVAHGRFLASEF